MKAVAGFILCFIALAVGQDKYESVGEDINISEVLENERLLNSYVKCLLDKGPCTPDLKKIKEKLPDALKTNCEKCTDMQKQIAKKLATELKNKHPDLWNDLSKHYDPEGKYEKAFKDFLKN